MEGEEGCLCRQQASTRKRKRGAELIKAMEAIEETGICVNSDAQCQRRKDKNVGHSYALWLGDFTGGALRL